MELDELKDAWTQYDKKLTDNLKLNEELLRKMNLNNSRREMQKPLIYEFGNIIVLFVLLVYVLASSLRLISEPKFCVPGFMASAICLFGLMTTVVKINRFLSIDYFGSSILKLQKDIASLNKLILRMRKFELSLLPILAVLLLPILFKSVRNIDIYSHLRLFIIEIVLVVAISMPVTFWINKQLYDKKFKNAEKLLSELEKFEREE